MLTLPLLSCPGAVCCRIPDSEAEQPEDWDERPQIEDAAAVKPKGWMDDAPAFISDPSATR